MAILIVSSPVRLSILQAKNNFSRGGIPKPLPIPRRIDPCLRIPEEAAG